MMDSMDRAKVVRAHLAAISRGKSPAPETVGVWLKEVQPIPTDKLDDLIRQARTEHAERLELGKAWGHITPDDVLRVHRRLRRKKGAAGNDPPQSPEDCQYGCDSGRVSVIDHEGYDYCVRCACSAGDWWRSNKVYGAGPDVAQATARPGWRLATTKTTLPPKHQEWGNKRSEQIGIAKALKEYADWLAKQAAK